MQKALCPNAKRLFGVNPFGVAGRYQLTSVDLHYVPIVPE